MSQYIKITFQSTGGEFSFGKVEDENVKSEILDLIEDGEEIKLGTEFSDGIELEFFNYTSLYGKYSTILQDSTRVEIEYTNDEEFEDIDYDNEKNQILNFEDSNINSCIIENPYIEDEEESIYIGGFIEEKRVRFSFGITLEDNEVFNLENLFIATSNLDETLGDYEVIEKAFYIPQKAQTEILKKIYEEDYSEDLELEHDLISELYMENDQEMINIFEKYKVPNVGEIEGKGETESVYTFVFDNNMNLLSEHEQY